MTDVELEARVTVLEENGAGNVQNSNVDKLNKIFSWYIPVT